jgi:S-sulfo-L-cysteine synthase (O-acetyl-L-serine-dependent)
VTAPIAALTFRRGPHPLADVTAAVGNTPLVRIRHTQREFPGVDLLGKLEGFNPGGSVKDRAGLQMIRDAIDRGQLAGGRTLIDSTAGNTGIAYAWIGALLGIPVALVMQPSVSEARKQITKAFGAQQIFSNAAEGGDGAIRYCHELVARNPDKYFLANQYSNESNPKAHALTTAPEIWNQTAGRITHVIAGAGTGGTIIGTGRRLRQLNPRIKVIAVEPAEPCHSFDGLKHMASAAHVPSIYNTAELDEIIAITSDEGWAATERLGREEGLFVGHSAGAAFAAALKVAQRLHERGEAGVVVTIFADFRERYFAAPSVII